MDFLPEEIEAFRGRYNEVFTPHITYDEATDLMLRLEPIYRMTLGLPKPPPPSILDRSVQ